MLFTPRSREELVDWLKSRKASPLHVTSGRNESEQAETISTSTLNRMINYEPDEMIVMCEAGMLITDLNSQLASQGQWIPTMANFHSTTATVGSVLAAGSYHPRNRSSSPLPTVVLGGTFATPQGELFKSGSRVVKSVAGYDTHRAFVGSKGLFGVIIEVTLKVQPLPERFVRFISEGSSGQLGKYQPLISEPAQAGTLVELGSYTEDIDADIESLSSEGLIARELGEGWENEIQLAERTNNETPAEKALFERLRRAFDPTSLLY